MLLDDSELRVEVVRHDMPLGRVASMTLTHLPTGTVVSMDFSEASAAHGVVKKLLVAELQERLDERVQS